MREMATGLNRKLTNKSERLTKFCLNRVLASAVLVNQGSFQVSERIPEPPPVPEPSAAPDILTDTVNQLNALGEQTFASLGLGGWTPVGIVQNCFEYLNVVLGIPWWEAIILGKFCDVSSTQ